MNVVVFGASGMIGQGVLRECLLAEDVERVVAVGRSPLEVKDAKLIDVVHGDFTDFMPIAEKLVGFDTCFYCLGVSAAGMNEEEYTRVTYDYAMAAARLLVEQNPGMAFGFISGASTDSSEKGSTMWARVKGKTENALLALPFGKVAMFRPGLIRPMHGARSRTTSYRVFYALATPVMPLLQRLTPGLATTTEIVGRAMLRFAREGAPKKILESRDINELGRA
jgi:uncharacterized protein YbjT (DUF2867 family)